MTSYLTRRVVLDGRCFTTSKGTFEKRNISQKSGEERERWTTKKIYGKPNFSRLKLL